MIDSISTQHEKISQLRDGSILILTKDQNIADKFINSKIFDSVCPVNIKLHSNLNVSKGIAYAPCLINVPEAEIISELKSQFVCDVYKFTKTIINEEDQKITNPTGLMIFSFDLFKIPDSLEIGWYRTKISEYIPNPMRCRQCQRLGHTMKWCKNPASCVTCNFPLHDGKICTRTECVNCSGPHPASSKTCPRYIQSKEVLEIKTKNKCTLTEARRMQRERYQSHSTTSSVLFSEKLKNPPPVTAKTSQPSISSSNHQTINENITQFLSPNQIQTELQKNNPKQIKKTTITEHVKINNEMISNLHTNDKKIYSTTITENNLNDNTTHSLEQTQTPISSTSSNPINSLQTITSSVQIQSPMNIDNDYDIS